MRDAAVLGATLLLFASTAYAASSGLPDGAEKKICKAGTTTQQSARLDNKNFCANDYVTMNALGQNVDKITCICRTQQELQKIGCAEGEVQPVVTVAISRYISGCKSDIVKISKCVADPKAAYTAACASGTSATGNSGDISIAATSWSVDDITKFAMPSTDEATTKALTNLGVSQEDATKLVAENKQDALDLIRTYASGDTEAVKAKASELHLNPDLSDVASLQVKPPSSGDSPETTSDTPPPASGVTGFRSETADAGKQCGFDGYAGGFMAAESACGRYLSNPLSGVQGTHHFLCSTWNQYLIDTSKTQYSCKCTDGGYYDGACSYVNDAAISSEVVNARYAKFEQVYGDQCARNNIGISACMYAIHVFGEGGFQGMIKAASMDPNASAWSLCGAGSALASGACNGNRSIFDNGGTVAGVFNELGRRVSGGAGSGYAGGSSKGYFANDVTSPFDVTNGGVVITPQEHASSPIGIDIMTLLPILRQLAAQNSRAAQDQQKVQAPPPPPVQQPARPQPIFQPPSNQPSQPDQKNASQISKQK